MRPQACLFDAVTAALNPETVNEVLVTMRHLAADDMTCVLVTHKMGFARKVADHVCPMDKGGIVEHAPPTAFSKKRLTRGHNLSSRRSSTPLDCLPPGKHEEDRRQSSSRQHKGTVAIASAIRLLECSCQPCRR